MSASNQEGILQALHFKIILLGKGFIYSVDDLKMIRDELDETIKEAGS